MPKYVVSSTLKDPEWNNSTVLEGDLADAVADVKGRHDGDVVVHGSAQLAQALIEQDLVDGVRVMVFPVVLGSGKRLCGETSDKKPMKLTSSSTVGDGVEILIYEPDRSCCDEIRQERGSYSRPVADSSLAIETHDLRRTFKGGVEAVRGIDLWIAPGEVFGFLGPNGAGKTTTVRILCTLLPPTAGRASVAGIDVVSDAAEVRRRIGVALQEIGLDPVQTGRELLELQCGLYGITGADAKRRAEELLELVGIIDAADRRTKTYSGG